VGRQDCGDTREKAGKANSEMAKTTLKVVVTTESQPNAGTLKKLVTAALEKDKILKGNVVVSKPHDGK
jgi:hypothetical protein